MPQNYFTNPQAQALQGPYAPQQQEILRRQKMAQLLQQQAMQPIEAPQTPAGGFAAPISPLQVAAKVMQGYKGGQLEKQAGIQQQQLAEQMQAERQKALAAALQQAGGSPQPAPELGGGPAMPPDPMGAAGTLAGSQDPMLAQAGMGMVGKGFENMLPQRPKAPEPYNLSPGQQRRGPNNELLATAPPNQSAQRASDSQYFMPIQTAKGIYAFNARTGTMELIQPGVVGAVADPTLQGNLAEAKARGTVVGKSGAEREFNMEGIGGIIQTAEDILSGVKQEGGVTVPGTKPTQSGLGTAVDIAGGFFGMSPQGAAEAQQLKALGGALTAKMPRMQGPQSDRDVVLYRQMAAEIGDSTVPIERRKAALKTVKQLWSKYEHLNPEAFTQPTPQPSPQPQTPSRRSTDRLSPQEQQELDALRKRFGR